FVDGFAQRLPAPPMLGPVGSTGPRDTAVGASTVAVSDHRPMATDDAVQPPVSPPTRGSRPEGPRPIVHFLAGQGLGARAGRHREIGLGTLPRRPERAAALSAAVSSVGPTVQLQPGSVMVWDLNPAEPVTLRTDGPVDVLLLDHG